jgi:hypothetical protein
MTLHRKIPPKTMLFRGLDLCLGRSHHFMEAELFRINNNNWSKTLKRMIFFNSDTLRMSKINRHLSFKTLLTLRKEEWIRRMIKIIHLCVTKIPSRFLLHKKAVLLLKKTKTLRYLPYKERVGPLIVSIFLGLKPVKMNHGIGRQNNH